MPSGIRGLNLRVAEAAAEFEHDDHRPAAPRGEVADRLAERRGRGAGAARPAAAPDSGPWPLGKPGLMFSP